MTSWTSPTFGTKASPGGNTIANDAAVVVSPDGGKVEVIGQAIGKNFGVYGVDHRGLLADP